MEIRPHAKGARQGESSGRFSRVLRDRRVRAAAALLAVSLVGFVVGVIEPITPNGAGSTRVNPKSPE